MGVCCPHWQTGHDFFTVLQQDFGTIGRSEQQERLTTRSTEQHVPA
ncbi:MAG: hypothetical protein HY914_15035 [Desulfomonile tiedjei]|nr:hypothetical protein [Desulfomonile tiedjei]